MNSLQTNVRIDCVAMLQVQATENIVDVPKDAHEKPCDVNYLFPFSIIF
jgi:hypothetical protein